MERAATVIIQSSCIFFTYRRRVVSYWADSHARQRILFCFLACFSYIAVPTHTHKAETRLQGNSPATVYHNSHTPCYIYIVGLYKYIYTPTVQQRYFTAQNTPPPLSLLHITKQTQHGKIYFLSLSLHIYYDLQG